MLKDILFVLYTAMIPLVPLWGADHYKKCSRPNKRLVCLALFGMQTLLSLGCILTYFGVI